MALRFPVLFVDFVDFSSLRLPSSVGIVSPAIPSYVTPSYYAVLDMIDVSSLSAVYRPQITAFSSIPSSFVLCFTFYVLLLLPFGLDFYGVCLCWIMDLECVCLVLRSWQQSLVSAFFNPHGSLSSPHVVSACVTSPFCFSFVTVSGLLRRSPPSLSSRNLHLSLRLRPSTLVLVRQRSRRWALVWTLDRRRGVLSQMQG